MGNARLSPVEPGNTNGLQYRIQAAGDFGQVRKLVGRALEIRRLMHEPVSLGPDPRATPTTGDALVGRSPAMQEVYKAIGRVAARKVNVLIRGESGTGKELVARAVHDNSPRADKPFVKVHCAALAPGLLESELFGHVKGSFTGAVRDKQGLFAAARGGSFFSTLEVVPRVMLGYPLVAMGAGMMLLAVLGGTVLPGSGPLVYLGKISYGLYVFHPLGLLIARYIDPYKATRGSFGRFLVQDGIALMTTIALATASALPTR